MAENGADGKKCLLLRKTFEFSDIVCLTERATCILLLSVAPKVFAAALKILNLPVLNHLKNCARTGKLQVKLQFASIVQYLKYNYHVSEEEALYCQRGVLSILGGLCDRLEVDIPESLCLPDMSGFDCEFVPTSSEHYSCSKILFEDFVTRGDERMLLNTAAGFSEEEIAWALSFCEDGKKALERLVSDYEEDKTERILFLMNDNSLEDAAYFWRVQHAQSQIIERYRWKYENDRDDRIFEYDGSDYPRLNGYEESDRKNSSAGDMCFCFEDFPLLDDEILTCLMSDDFPCGEESGNDIDDDFNLPAFGETMGEILAYAARRSGKSVVRRLQSLVGKKIPENECRSFLSALGENNGRMILHSADFQVRLIFAVESVCKKRNLSLPAGFRFPNDAEVLDMLCENLENYCFTVDFKVFEDIIRLPECYVLESLQKVPSKRSLFFALYFASDALRQKFYSVLGGKTAESLKKRLEYAKKTGERVGVRDIQEAQARILDNIRELNIGNIQMRLDLNRCFHAESKKDSCGMNEILTQEQIDQLLLAI